MINCTRGKGMKPVKPEESKNSIEIVFSDAEGAQRAAGITETMLTVIYHFRCMLPFAGMPVNIVSPWMNEARKGGYEETASFGNLWRDYQIHLAKVEMFRRLNRTDPETDARLREMFSHIRKDGPRFTVDDCSGFFSDERIDIMYYMDYFSMLCLMSAAMYPGTTFKGFHRVHDPHWYSRRLLNRAEFDGRVLTFTQLVGYPGYSGKMITWTGTGERLEIRKSGFPYIRVDIFTDDRETLRNDGEISRWISRLNDAEEELISAELDCFPGRSCVMLQPPAGETLRQLRDELLGMLAPKGYRTGTAGTGEQV